MSETVIVAALRRGNLRRAVELILDSYQDDVYGYCASALGAADPADVYQQVLIAALEELPAFQGVISVRAWLYGIARRVVLHHQRQSPSSVPSVEESALDIGLRPADAELDRCLAALEAPVREVLQLTLWHGLLLSEVAHITERSLPQTRRMAAEGLSSLCGFLQRSIGVPS